MDVVNRFGYLALGVSDLDEAIEFYSRFVRLDLTERQGKTAFMTGGLDHHWIRLEEGGTQSEQGLKRIAYEVVDDSSFAVIRERLQEWGIEYTEGGDPRSERVQRWLRFVDPGGFEIELFHGMYERGVAPANPGVNLEKFLHAGWEVTDWETNVRFYQEVLGFKASDWIGDMVGFFRAGDRYHHSLVLIRAPKPGFNHFCVQVESIDDVMRFRHNAVKGGVELRDDLLRHAPSGSIGVYMKDVARGFSVEYCVGHPQVDDASHSARILPMAVETVDIWRSPLPEMAANPSTLAMGPPPAKPPAESPDAGIVPQTGGNSADALLERAGAN